MKAKQIILTALVILTGVGMGTARGATNEVSALLQKGLFEEEANHNLDAAIQAYQAVVTQTEKDRQFAATAIFRLGECYRKLGKTNEANVEYQRILKEFADQTELAKLSQSYLGEAASATAVLTGLGGTGVLPYQAIDPEQDELKRIQAMIKDSPDLINSQTLPGQPGSSVPLVEAARQNYLAVARFLLDNKADVNARHGTATALSVAVDAGHKEMVELLVDRGAEVNNSDEPLNLAAQRGYKAIAEVLLAHKADVNIKDPAGNTPLHWAALKGFLSVAELLLAHGANINARNQTGETPLHYAAKTDNTAIMELLIAHKAEVDAKARDGATPLLAAVAAARLNAAKVLLANKADVNVKITGGEGHFTVSAYTRGVGSSQNYDGWTALHFAIAEGQPELVKLLLENQADANSKAPDYNGSRDIAPLSMAALNGQKYSAEPLLEHHADINATDKHLDTALSIAAQHNNLEMAELLFAHGATVQTLDNDHWSPLSRAVYNKSADMVKLLLAHKPELEVVDGDDFTPLQRAALNDDEKVAGLLLDAGAFVDPGYKGDGGRSPLERAVLQRKKGMVALLLDHHANPNFQDNSGNTPLTVAKQQLPGYANNPAMTQGYTEIIDLLQNAGANENLQRLTRIGVSRSGYEEQIFYKGTNSFNHYTLFELLAHHYMIGGQHSPGNTSPSGLKFPDFSKLKINRLQKDGRTNTISLDLEAAFNAGDCSKDVPLEWGDIVEIPELDHNVTESWPGLPDPVYGTLGKCLESKVNIVVKGQSNLVTLKPLFYGRWPGGVGPMPYSGGPTSGTQLHTFWLYGVVHGANVIVTSSDLSRVKVKRVDPVSRKPVEMVFNLSPGVPVELLWLRDGDVIEVPEKP